MKLRIVSVSGGKDSTALYLWAIVAARMAAIAGIQKLEELA